MTIILVSLSIWLRNGVRVIVRYILCGYRGCAWDIYRTVQVASSKDPSLDPDPDLALFCTVSIKGSDRVSDNKGVARDTTSFLLLLAFYCRRRWSLSFKFLTYVEEYLWIGSV